MGKNAIWKNQSEINNPIVWSSDEYLKRLLTRGNELGRPSYSLIRADVIEKNDEAWENDKSCDLIMNLIVASRGKVVLLPQGCIITGIHENQDGATQNYELILNRLCNSLFYLKKYDKKFGNFVQIYGFVEFFYMIKIFLATIIRRKNPFYLKIPIDFIKLISIFNIKKIFLHSLSLTNRIK